MFALKAALAEALEARVKAEAKVAKLTHGAEAKEHKNIYRSGSMPTNLGTIIPLCLSQPCTAVTLSITLTLALALALLALAPAGTECSLSWDGLTFTFTLTLALGPWPSP